MSEPKINVGNVEHCQALLAQLPGVFASGIRLDQGEMVEIHILASASRSAKQIVRDVQSAIFAVYGVEVDHRIISVAQLRAFNRSACSSAPARTAALWRWRGTRSSMR